jgi:DNA-binding beta-propeller fold protein YncE
MHLCGSMWRRTALAVAALVSALRCAKSAKPKPPLPLTLVADVALPGNVSRFDYQDVGLTRGHLFIAHMGDDEVVVVALQDGSTVKRLPGIGIVRGIQVAPEVNLVFASAAATNELVRIDANTLTESDRTATGNSPDGLGWNPVHSVVGVSDQGDGAISLIAGTGAGTRIQVPLGLETGNVVFDPSRGCFWITVVMATPPDKLIAVNPVAGTLADQIDLPGCTGAHGLRLHPDANSAFVACETNNVALRVGLDPAHAIATAPVGVTPDVQAIDAGLG